MRHSNKKITLGRSITATVIDSLFSRDPIFEPDPAALRCSDPVAALLRRPI